MEPRELVIGPRAKQSLNDDPKVAKGFATLSLSKQIFTREGADNEAQVHSYTPWLTSALVGRFWDASGRFWEASGPRIPARVPVPVSGKDFAKEWVWNHAPPKCTKEYK